jgi:hypothetical protein
MEYQDFELQIGPQLDAGLLVRVRSPAGEGEALVHLPRFAVDLEHPAGAARHFSAGASALPMAPAEVGGDLYGSIFVGQVSSLFQQSLSRVEASACGLRLRVRINLRDRTLAPLLDLPWELLYRQDTEEFLALSRGTPIVRALEVPRPAAVRMYRPPLRILAVLARDPQSSPLSLEEELKQFRESLEQDSEIQLETLEDPDPQTLRNALDQKAFHILHYMGHGAFEPASGEGALLFGGPAGRQPVTGRHLATKVKDLDALRLVVLNACETAVVGGEAAQPFAGVAAALVLGGLPAVVAMQSSIRDIHAVAFTSAFYRRLAGGMSVEEAVTEGRQAILSQEPDTAAWANPVLFLRTAGDLFAPEPGALAPPRARQGGRSFATRIVLLGLLAVALGAGLMNRFGDGFRSSRHEAGVVPLATPPKTQPEKPGPAHPLPPRPTVSPAPSSDQTVAPPPPRQKREKSPPPVRWVRLELAIPAGFQHGTILVDGSPARVLDRLPNFIDIEVPDSDQPVAVRVEGRGRVCEQTVLASPTSGPVNICEGGY